MMDSSNPRGDCVTVQSALGVEKRWKSKGLRISQKTDSKETFLHVV